MNILSIRHLWPENAGFRLRRPNGAAEYVLLHFHNSVEISFGGKTIRTRPDALIVFAPGTPHIFHSPGPLTHDWMHISGNLAREMEQFGLKPDTLYQLSCGRQICQTTAFLEEEFFARRSYWQNLANAQLRSMLILIARDISGELAQPLPPCTADKLRSLRGEMLKSPERAWTNEAMAKFVNISMPRLYPLYKRMFNISPNRDLILMRIDKAKNLLLSGESVTGTAERMGYSSNYHFIRQFRQITGVTPGKFAREAAEEIDFSNKNPYNHSDEI